MPSPPKQWELSTTLSSTDPHAITIGCAADSSPLTKTYEKSYGAWRKVRSAPTVANWLFMTAIVPDLQGMADLLSELSSAGAACLIRAGLDPATPQERLPGSNAAITRDEHRRAWPSTSKCR